MLETEEEEERFAITHLHCDSLCPVLHYVYNVQFLVDENVAVENCCPVLIQNDSVWKQTRALTSLVLSGCKVSLDCC